MKTIKLLLLSGIVISFMSCSDENESPSLSEEEKMLVGAWQIQSFNYSGTSTGNFSGMEVSSSYQGVAHDIDAVLTFRDNRTFGMQGSYNVTLTVEGFDFLVPIEDASSSGDWYVEGEYLYTSNALGQVNNQMVQSPEDGRMRIQESTENRMVLLIDQEEEISQNGVDYLVEVSGQYVLTK